MLAVRAICVARWFDRGAVQQQADIVVACAGSPELVKGDWLKPGAVVVDVGFNKVDDEDSAKGYRLTGDVEFSEVRATGMRDDFFGACDTCWGVQAVKRARAITPIPGGVGPVTIAMLLRSTLQAAQSATNLSRSR